MDYDFLFTKDDTICFKILKTFTQNTSMNIAKERISNSFSLTYYQINKYFDAINADLLSITVDTPSYIDEETKGVWEIHHFNTYTLQKIALLYLQRSPLFTALEYRFFYSNHYSKAQFIERNFMSNTVFYNASNKLEAILQANSFYSANSFNGNNESLVRLSLFQLYYTLYNGISTPFKELNATIKQITKLLQKSLGYTMTPTQITKLSIFSRIWLLRIFNQQSTEQSNKLDMSNYKQLMTSISDILSPQIEISTNELHYFFTFLLTQRYLPEEPAMKLVGQFPLAEKLTNRFIDELREQPSLLNTDQLNNEDLRHQLFNIHLELTTFYVEPTTFIDSTQISFFQDLYPTFDSMINHFIEDIRYDPHLNLSQNMGINLYFSYMFALIKSIPVNLVRDRVYVCVDFSQGALYSNYIIESLSSFHHAHLVVESSVSSKTDVYISDFHSDIVSALQVIWQNPPTPVDWSELADRILEIKQQKLHQFPKWV